MKQKILSVVWYKVLPAHFGGQQGIAIFNQYLGKLTDLTCVCSCNNEKEAGLSYNLIPELPVSKSQFINPLVRNKIINLIKENKYTHIIIEHPYHAWLADYKNKLNFKLIVHAHNIEYLRMKERRKWWWRWVKHTEQKAFSKADHILFKTEKDIKLAVSLFNTDSTRCLLLPYGIAEKSWYSPIPGAREMIRLNHNLLPEEKIFLFAGTLDYEPNKEAVDNIIHNVLPELLKKDGLNFKIIICGKLSKKDIQLLNRHPNIIATGFVSSIEEYFYATDVFLNPVLSGSGVQTKNFEAVANGLSIAATSFAAEGLPDYLTDTKVLISPNNNWKTFAENAITLSQKKQKTPDQFYSDFYWGNLITKILTKLT
ncbi:MAG: glycosyltransferase family 4 protein [Sphingobacteriales bacterium]|nr:glycosyltransferase family 4 protein [Sphingobacteriales bacterium]